MKPILPLLALSIFCLAATGCATVVRGTHDWKGSIPYYLPKPCFLVSKNFHVMDAKKTTSTKREIVDATKKDGTKKESTTSAATAEPALTKLDAQGDSYLYRLVYLPDFNEKQGLRFVRGTGTYKGQLSLVDGWQFTGINLEADAKTPETIQAIGEVAAEVGKLFLAAEGDPELLREMMGELRPAPPRDRGEAELWLSCMGKDGVFEELRPIWSGGASSGG